MIKIKPKIITDISNIAGHYNEFPPKVKNIDIMFNTLKYEFWIIGIADLKLFRCIDYPLSYKYYLDQRIIFETLPFIKADVMMIMSAVEGDYLMLTNDKLKDYEDLIPSESWLKDHRVPFDIVNGEFKYYLPK